METASYETFPELWKTLVHDFGPEREKSGLWKHIYPSNAFIGYFLRLELLYNAKEYEKVLENIKDFFGYMAEETGTLWEHKTSHASCNHGFASHITVWLK